MLKIARLTLLVDPNRKDVFERPCALQGRTVPPVARQLTRGDLAQHDVRFLALDGGRERVPLPRPVGASPTPHSLEPALSMRRHAARLSAPASES